MELEYEGLNAEGMAKRNGTKEHRMLSNYGICAADQTPTWELRYINPSQ